MKLSVTNLNSFIGGLNKLKAEPEKIIRRKVVVALKLVHKNVTIRTPVHTGKSLRNWVWTMDRPSSASNMPAAGSGPTGQTSKMTLGSEPRRPANQATVDATYQALDLSKPMRAYWLTNNSSEILDLEYGKLPTSEGSRNPAGMVRVTFQELIASLRRK